MKLIETEYFHGRKSKPFSIFSIDFHDSLIASGSINGELKIYNQRQAKVYKDHVGSVLCVRFNKKDLLATSGDDKSIVIYQKDKKGAYKYLKKIQTHFSDVSCVLWTSNALLSCGYDGQIFIYNTLDFSVIKCIKRENMWRGMSVDPQETVIVCQSDFEMLILNSNFEIMQSIQEPFQGKITEAFFARSSWSPNGKYLVFGLAHNNKSNSVEIYNKNGFKREFSLIGHVAPCEAMAFYPYMLEDEGMIVALGSQDKSISFWYNKNQRPFLLLKNVFDQPILDMFWKDNDLYACSYDGFVKIVRFENNELGVLEENFTMTESHLSQIPYSKTNIDIANKGIDYIVNNNEASLFKSLTDDEYKNLIDSLYFEYPDTETAKSAFNINSIEDVRGSKNSIQDTVGSKLQEGTVTTLKKEESGRVSGHPNIDRGIKDKADTISNHLETSKQIEKQEVVDTKTSMKQINSKDKLETHETEFKNNTNTSTDLVKKRKRIQPVLIEPLKQDSASFIDKQTQTVVIFKPQLDPKMIKIDAIGSEYEYKAEEYTVKIQNGNKSTITIFFGTKELYKLHYAPVSLFACNKDYVCLVVKEANSDAFIMHYIETGVIVMPIISYFYITAISLLNHKLLILSGNSTFQVFNVKKQEEMASGYLPSTYELLNIKLDKKYFLIALFKSGVYFYDLKMKCWYKKSHEFDTIFLDNNKQTFFDESSENDETISKLEYKFKVYEKTKNITQMIKTTHKIVNMCTKMTTFDDFLANKLHSIFEILCLNEQRKVVIKFLEEMNVVVILQPFVCQMIKHFTQTI